LRSGLDYSLLTGVEGSAACLRRIAKASRQRFFRRFKVQSPFLGGFPKCPSTAQQQKYEQRAQSRA
jgi:hypothetical protein